MSGWIRTAAGPHPSTVSNCSHASPLQHLPHPPRKPTKKQQLQESTAARRRNCAEFTQLMPDKQTKRRGVFNLETACNPYAATVQLKVYTFPQNGWLADYEANLCKVELTLIRCASLTLWTFLNSPVGRRKRRGPSTCFTSVLNPTCGWKKNVCAHQLKH